MTFWVCYLPFHRIIEHPRKVIHHSSYIQLILESQVFRYKKKEMATKLAFVFVFVALIAGIGSTARVSINQHHGGLLKGFGESCVSGLACTDCSVTAGINGVTYCCDNNCDSGWVDVDSTRDPICLCGHWSLFVWNGIDHHVLKSNTCPLYDSLALSSSSSQVNWAP